MAYYSGMLLNRRIYEYDLTVLDEKMTAIRTGTDRTWPSGGYGQVQVD